MAPLAVATRPGWALACPIHCAMVLRILVSDLPSKNHVFHHTSLAKIEADQVISVALVAFLKSVATCIKKSYR